MKIYIINQLLLLLRYVLVLKPCPGYIHPDEYFQSPELMAHDFLHLKANVTWEWQGDTPIRNIFHPIISSGFAFWFLKLFKFLFGIHYNAEILVLIPRIISIIFVYFTEKNFLKLMRLACRNNVHYFGLFLFRTSFISLLFMARPFSNIVETMLFSVLLTKILINCIDTIKVNRTSLLTIGFMTALGFFMRPTFLIFLFYPMMHLLILSAIKSRKVTQTLRMLIFIFVGFCSGVFIMLILDYIYYSKNLTLQWPPLTPMNFILYNTNVENVKKHGLHPRYTHFAINMFALFGPLYFFPIKYAILKFYQLLYIFKETEKSNDILKYLLLDGREKVKIFLLISSICPILILSLIPHQEARFLLPVFVPITIIITSELFNAEKQRKWIALWLLFNLGCLIWYGFLHQSGVYKSLAFMNNVLNRHHDKQTNHTLIYWHTYMVPQHLLGVADNNNKVKVFDLGGTQYHVVGDIINRITEQSKSGEKNEIWLFCPSSLQRDVEFKVEKQFFPHVSMEDLPKDISFKFAFDAFSLNVYHISI